MNRLVKCDCSIIDAKNEFIIELWQKDIILFSLELSMLTMGLINQLNILFSDNYSLQILLDGSLELGEKAVVNKKANDKVSISLSGNHLEYICASLLRAYRDQLAEVNHIHVEGINNNEDYDLTLMFENVCKPLTQEEVSKLLCID